MKIFSAKQVYEADRSTIEKQQIPSSVLMERASEELFRWLHGQLKGAQVPIHLFCGIGNNGGDGLALARHLEQHGYLIKVYVVTYSEKRSEDFLLNLDRLKEKKVWPDFIHEETGLPAIMAGDIVVDAIFGIGLNRPPAQWVGNLIKHLNATAAFRVSVDVPSGLYLDKATGHDAVVKAHVVLSFQAPKLVFFLPETGPYCEQWEILDIGLDPEYLQNTETEYKLVGKDEARSHYRPRTRFSHKGTYGHALVIGGSHGKTGAVQLSASASLTSGSGLVTAYVPKAAYLPLQTAIPEVMLLTDTGENHITGITYDLKPDAIGIGIGLGTHADTVKALAAFLEQYDGPLVIDADAINILAGRDEMLSKLPPKTILTPHPGELKRLIGNWEDDYDKLAKAHAFSRKYDCILLIKGAYSMTLYGGKGYVNSSGNPGMATAGSGDVLTGIITGLLSQGYGPLEATVFGTYLHGRAGDIGAAHHGYEALTARGIIECLGLAFIDLLNDDKEPAESKDPD